MSGEQEPNSATARTVANLKWENKNNIIRAGWNGTNRPPFDSFGSAILTAAAPATATN